MKNRIIKHINELEKKQNIRVLLAVETGSRAWGFPSPDSDYDVRLIYVHSKEWYVGLFEGQDHLSYMSDDGELDLTGWELRKALRLLAKSNGAMLERIQSPIIYKAVDRFAEKMQALSTTFYSPVAIMHHYRSMAHKSLESMVDKEAYRLKDLFYALRATCACLWVLEQEVNPPIVFKQLLDGIDLSAPLRERMALLNDLKATKSEAYLHSGEDMLTDFIKESLEKVAATKDTLKCGSGDLEKLDVFLRSEIGL